MIESFGFNDLGVVTRYIRVRAKVRPGRAGP